MFLTFRVIPGDLIFQTSDLGPRFPYGGPGDQNDAFRRAHEYAAASAARFKKPHHVLRGDGKSEERIGFGSWNAPMLLAIQNKGHASFFDLASVAWVPLN